MHGLISDQISEYQVPFEFNNIVNVTRKQTFWQPMAAP